MTRVVYFFLVVLVWIAQFVVGGLYLAQTESSEGSLLYEVNTVGVAIINFILSVAFFFYGFRWFLLARSSPGRNLPASSLFPLLSPSALSLLHSIYLSGFKYPPAPL
jgi:hypothetical protein